MRVFCRLAGSLRRRPAHGRRMIPKHIDQIAAADLDALQGLRESKTLEFKRELLAGPISYRKLVAGVSALANTAGGDFVIGVTEAGGAAVEFSGIPHDDIDAYKRSLAQVLGAQIEPGLPSIDMREVSCGEGRWVLFIRVARRWIGPHRNLYDNHFYVRTSGPATVALGVGELRTAFGLRESGIERIEAFRTERLVRLMAGEGPIPVHDWSGYVLLLSAMSPGRAQPQLQILRPARSPHAQLARSNGLARVHLGATSCNLTHIAACKLMAEVRQPRPMSSTPLLFARLSSK